MDLPLFTRSGTKPGLDIYVNSVNAKTFSVTESAEIKGNLNILGSIASTNLSPGQILFASGTQSIALTGTQGGGNIVYNPTFDRLILSGVTGQPASSSSNGSTFTVLTTGVTNSLIGYSPTLAIYTCINSSGTAISTSDSGLDGSWVVRAVAPSAFSASRIFCSTYFGRFYTGAADVARSIFSSTDGITYATQASARDMSGMAFSPTLNRLVCVGSLGPQYTDNGTTWIPCTQTNAMSDVCWSPEWKCFVATPKNAPLNIIWRSTNGIIWISSPNSTFVNMRAICWCPDLMCFVISGDNDVHFVSQDGYTWRKIQVTVSGLSAYVNTYIAQWGMFIAAGIGSFVRVSPKVFAF